MLLLKLVEGLVLKELLFGGVHLLLSFLLIQVLLVAVNTVL